MSEAYAVRVDSTLFIPMEPNSPWIDHIEAWFETSGVPSIRQELGGIFHLGYPIAYESRVEVELARFRARRAWSLAGAIYEEVSGRAHFNTYPKEWLFTVSSLIETLYLVDGVPSDLCDECGVSVPLEVFNGHQHLNRRSL